MQRGWDGKGGPARGMSWGSELQKCCGKSILIRQTPLTRMQRRSRRGLSLGCLALLDSQEVRRIGNHQANSEEDKQRKKDECGEKRRNNVEMGRAAAAGGDWYFYYSDENAAAGGSLLGWLQWVCEDGGGRGGDGEGGLLGWCWALLAG